MSGLDPATICALSNQLRQVQVSRGEMLYCQDEPADGLHIILVGKVKICCHSADGREQLLAVRGPGDILGAVSVLDRGTRTATAIAVTDVCTAFVDDDTLQVWMTERPQIAQKLLRFMAGRLRLANNHLLDIIFDDVPGRVAKELLHLAQRFGTQTGESWHVTHDLTQAEIAQLIGATRESVNKALCDFVQRGWITTNGKTTLIHRPQLLAKRAG
ncbi:Crp/Fnr family transcriptional regulator [Mycolicibacterium tusciae]|uniref:Crp/Fnr family transcriptional regulator n=1 Tax=Mycolicibacterium tusciae TaxID=75922 RepID=UPI0004894C77|nr:Crp/Fnr family transcriptional regulator [Mycolicibacterium tusciae]